MKLLLVSLLLICSYIKCATPPDGYLVWSNPSQALSDANIGKWFTAAINYYINSIVRQPRNLRYQSIRTVASSTQWVQDPTGSIKGSLLSGQRVQYDALIYNMTSGTTFGLILYVSYPLPSDNASLEDFETYSYP